MGIPDTPAELLITINDQMMVDMVLRCGRCPAERVTHLPREAALALEAAQPELGGWLVGVMCPA